MTIANSTASDAGRSAHTSGLIDPHGGSLVDLMVPEDQREEVRAAARSSVDKVVECSHRNACDVELLIVGGFSPLRGFMHQEDYESVVAGHRTTSGLLFGLPIVFDTDDDSIAVGDRLLLTYQGQDLAVLTVESRWEPDKVVEARGCYGTTSLEHPAVRMIATERGRHYLGGRIKGLGLPRRVFPCRTPAQVRSTLPPGEDVVAFQCRNPIHRAHYELFTRALDAPNVSREAVVLVHPTCGPTQEDDIAGEVRFATYERLAAEVANPRIRWAYLPYAMHMAGPREALQHMIIRKNYGCSHFIIGRDMAGCKSSLTGEDFYGPYEAQDFARDQATELSMETVPSLNLVYTEEEGYVTAEHAQARGLHIRKLSGTQFRQMLRSGEEIPEWFAFRSVVEVLRAVS
ncbi:sulfate adenylyltransferase [Synechococcus sp. CCY 9618]|uniref:sulfate adenylyltransferase n=1 Tax=Synechococcus sp. CCY 9618 TaxID=2815602 RepID=UPI001C23E1C0|nr:sulfate adenylyltransferase [Synechococcus sp. CCY 9618]